MLSGSVFTRLEMHCKTSIKWVYYGATKITAQKDLCCHCSKQGDQQDKKLKKLFKTVFPICDGCQAESKKVYKQGPIKTAAANQKRKFIKIYFLNLIYIITMPLFCCVYVIH